MKIYADHAATTKLDIDAFEAMKPFLLEEYANPSQMYSFARGVRRALQEARETIADCINALPNEIYFTSGGTEGDNWAIKGSAFRNNNKYAIITTEIEHHAVLRACSAIEKCGYPVAYLHPDPDGLISTNDLSKLITHNTHLVSIMSVNNEIGTIQPIRELAEVAHANGAFFHTDAVQAVGHLPIDVKAWDIDMLSASSHKFNGPKGIGFVYIRNGSEISPFSDGGSQERGMRAGTENIASIVGMAVALKKNLSYQVTRRNHLAHLESVIINGLNAHGIDYIQNGQKEHLPGILSLSFANANGETLLHRLDLKGIYVSTGSACNSTESELSHVIRAIAVPEKYAPGTIRISLDYENTEEEALTIVSAIHSILVT